MGTCRQLARDLLSGQDRDSRRPATRVGAAALCASVARIVVEVQMRGSEAAVRTKQAHTTRGRSASYGRQQWMDGEKSGEVKTKCLSRRKPLLQPDFTLHLLAMKDCVNRGRKTNMSQKGCQTSGEYWIFFLRKRCAGWMRQKFKTWKLRPRSLCTACTVLDTRKRVLVTFVVSEQPRAARVPLSPDPCTQAPKAVGTHVIDIRHRGTHPCLNPWTRPFFILGTCRVSILESRTIKR
jgi:hypothetical protein